MHVFKLKKERAFFFLGQRVAAAQPLRPLLAQSFAAVICGQIFEV